MKKIFLTSLLILAILAGDYLKVYAQALTNAICPVMPGERVKEKFFVDYNGQRIYLCCRNCVIAFRKKPEKYMKRLAALESETQ